jgi:hypothetical protein
MPPCSWELGSPGARRCRHTRSAFSPTPSQIIGRCLAHRCWRTMMRSARQEIDHVGVPSARRIAVVEDHPGAAEEFVAACCAAGCPAPSEVTPSTIEWRGRRGCSSSWRTPRDDLHDDYLWCFRRRLGCILLAVAVVHHQPQQLLEPLAVTAASSRGPSSLLPAGCSARVCLCTVNLAVLLTEVSGLKVMIFYYWYYHLVW